jgi:hypothetical protein
VEAVEQVLAEPAGFDVGEEVAVGRRDQPDIDLDRALAADRLDSPSWIARSS